MPLITGTSGNDRLDGSNQADEISGGAGNDTLVGWMGDDILSGGSGADRFVYDHFSINGHDTITDLSLEDTIEMVFMQATSLTQVGADVVIALSNGDSITCLNTDVATVAAVIVPESAVPPPPIPPVANPLPAPPPILPPPSGSIIPTLPQAPNPASSSTPFQIAPGATFTVTAGSSYFGDSGFDVWGGLVNYGTVWAQSALGAQSGVGLNNTGSWLINYGTVAAVSDQYAARGITVLNQFNAGAIINYGSVYAICQAGNAHGIWEDRAAASITNHGLIAVQAHEDPSDPYDPSNGFPRWTGNAYGIRDSGANTPILNGSNGQILVEGEWAVGIWSRGSDPALNIAYDINNQGLIRVNATYAGQPSYGLLLANSSLGSMSVINSGTIEADVAIYAPSSDIGILEGEFASGLVENAQRVTNTATGILGGDVILRTGNDILTTHGQIIGFVDMGTGDDQVDTSVGSITGPVYLGDGSDSFIGSSANDVVNGDSGDDTLVGNAGNDLLFGAGGNDQLTGGTGNDRLDGGLGSDTLNLSAGDSADGGQGNDRFVLSDYAFRVVDGGAGFDTLVLPSGARILDLSAAVSSLRLSGIEEIVLGGSKELVVRPADVAGITGGSNLLRIEASVGDKIDLVGSWTKGTDQVVGGLTYSVYTSGGSTILITQGAAVVLAATPPANALGLDAISPGAIAPSAASYGWDPNLDLHANFDPIDVSREVVRVDAAESWYNLRGTAVFFSDGYSSPEDTRIENYGLISSWGAGDIRFAQAIGFELGTIENYGSISAHNEGVWHARAILIVNRGPITNYGDIFATAEGGDATAILTADGTSGVFNGSTGYIGAFSMTGYAEGIRLINNVVTENGGTIEVQGSVGAVAVDSFNAGGSLINSGTIIASITSGGDGVSFGFITDGLGGANGANFLENSGLISADVAVFFQTRYGETFTIRNSGTIEGLVFWNIYSPEYNFGRLDLTNDGTIIGDIVTDTTSVGIETIENNGLIVGILDLAGGNDSYSGSNGHIDGSVWAGDGNDALTGGSGAENLYGDAGNDVLDGGQGNDLLEGGAGSDLLTGGAGSDTFRDTAAGLSGDTITDLSSGDKIVFTNATLATFAYNLSGNTLTYTGGSLTLTGPTNLTFVASAAAGGGVQLTVQAGPVPDAANDFNGDGRSDILFRHDNGAITNFLGTANGGILNNGDNVYTVVDNAWELAGTGDFNGDGRDDVLWRNDSGAIFNFLGTANGGVTNNGNNSYMSLNASWTVSGVGDFNGDGKDDILFRDANGVIFDYLGTATGGFTANTNNLYTDIADAWHVSGVGDFNGDGRDDILFRNTNGAITNFLGTANGGILNNGDNIYTVVGNAWHIAGVGDFNGDGRDDILWRNDNGAVFTFLSTANGGVINNGDNSYAAMSNVWHVEAIGDYNGDDRDDILWRHDNGTIIDWLGTASGGFTDNSANLYTSIATQWQVAPADALI